MENLSAATRVQRNSMDEHSIKFKSMFIEMDLAMHDGANSPRTLRFPKLESHEEFEFNMFQSTMKGHELSEQPMEVVCADKLFLNGQIAPLKKDPTLKTGQSAIPHRKRDAVFSGKVSSSFSHAGDSSVGLQAVNAGSSLNLSKHEHVQHASERGLYAVHGDEGGTGSSTLHNSASSDGFFHSNITKYMNEEPPGSSEFSLQDGSDLLRPCRLDGRFDIFCNDSFSSSFRSHQSHGTYSSCTEKESKDSSTTSSRCSTGSYQESILLQGLEKRVSQSSSAQTKTKTDRFTLNVTGTDAVHMHETMSNLQSRENVHQFTDNQKQGPASSPSSSSRTWSWKSLFGGLRKVPRPWCDESDGAPSKAATQGLQKKSLVAVRELPDLLNRESMIGHRRSIGEDTELLDNSYRSMKRDGSLKRDQGVPAAIYCVRSGGKQEGPGSSVSYGGPGNAADTRSKDQQGRMMQDCWACSGKDSWSSRCINKVKKGTRLSARACKLVVTAKQLDQSRSLERNAVTSMRPMMVGMRNEEDRRDAGIAYTASKPRSLSSTPLAKSPLRKADRGSAQNSLVAGVVGGSMVARLLLAGDPSCSCARKSSVSSKRAVGFSSCPASMRSSPHHSGVLAIVNKATPDLHTAIQSAIAHCKQSQLATSTPKSNSNHP